MPRWLTRWIARIPRWESRLAFADWVWRGATLFAALAVGLWTAGRAWVEGVITPYGTLGYVAVALCVALIITLILMGIAWTVDTFRHRIHSENEQRGRLSPPVVPLDAPSASPASPASPAIETIEERAAKHDLAVFVAEHIIPTYKAAVSLQEAIIRTICGKHTVIAQLAWTAFQKENNMREYTETMKQLDLAVQSGITNVSFSELTENVNEISKLHHALCSFNDWLAFVGDGRVGPPFDYRSNEATAALYQTWRERQTALVEAFQPFRRDIRFACFYDLSGQRGLGHPFETDA